ncbi:uncharacterized protein LOC116342023 [Contarinia nasturtii]|uniref:uncharacterized protein LOC116342023 n=1 Tax=Contarinia nasturtii TaxID=265458 RepID=UPI0012D455FC|nr:uncharacterized protein LOC116342023 [Contarinia nasturtii]
MFDQKLFTFFVVCFLICEIFNANVNAVENPSKKGKRIQLPQQKTSQAIAKQPKTLGQILNEPWSFRKPSSFVPPKATKTFAEILAEPSSFHKPNPTTGHDTNSQSDFSSSSSRNDEFASARSRLSSLPSFGSSSRYFSVSDCDRKEDHA